MGHAISLTRGRRRGVVRRSCDIYRVEDRKELAFPGVLAGRLTPRSPGGDDHVIALRRRGGRSHLRNLRNLCSSALLPVSHPATGRRREQRLRRLRRLETEEVIRP